jgi:cation transport regulator ChaC
MKTYVFGYGSLMNGTSAGSALGRPVAASDLVPAVLHGYRRTWAVKEAVYSHTLLRRIDAVFLDIAEDPSGWLNGVAIEVTPAELRQLGIREKNYDAMDVTPLVSLPPPGGDYRVLTFRGKPEQRVSPMDRDVFVLERYLEKVQEGCQGLGEDFARTFEETSEAPIFPVLEGAYTFVDEEQAAYA